MSYAIIHDSRTGHRAQHIARALMGNHAVHVIDTNELPMLFNLPGDVYLPWENKGVPLPLSWLTGLEPDYWFIICDHHAFINDTGRPGVFYHTEPYYAPSLVNPDVLLCPTPHIQGTWMQNWRAEYCRIPLVLDWPFACPTTEFNPNREKDLRGLNFLANLDFRPPSMKASYWENQALKNRQEVFTSMAGRGEVRVHHYPQPGFDPYRDIVERSEAMLCVPGNSCTINQQITECLAAGTIPHIYVEDDLAFDHFKRYGLVGGENCWFLNRPNRGTPTREACRALAEQHEYWSTYHAFSTNVIERAQRVKQNAERLRQSIEQCAV